MYHGSEIFVRGISSPKHGNFIFGTLWYPLEIQYGWKIPHFDGMSMFFPIYPLVNIQKNYEKVHHAING